MKKALCIPLAIVLALGITACAAPSVTGSDGLGAALQAATSVDEVAQIMKPYVISEDYETALRCADRMLEIDPKSEAAWSAKAEMQIRIILAEQEELNGIVAEGMGKMDDPAGYVDWLRRLPKTTVSPLSCRSFRIMDRLNR